jgi:hypothetical protein
MFPDHQQPSVQPASFWRSGGGIALIILGSLVALFALCIGGCIIMNIVGPPS